MNIFESMAAEIMDRKLYEDPDLKAMVDQASSDQLSEALFRAASVLEALPYRGWIKRRLQKAVVKTMRDRAQEYKDIPDN